VSGRPVPTVSVVVLAYLDEPWLVASVDAALGSEGVDVDVILVDNGCTSGAVALLADRPGVTVLRPGRNLGFAGGCNLGAAHATGEFVALVNGDATVAPDALARLADVAAQPDVGIATGSIRLAEDPARINSAGNPIHYLGLSWAGGFDEPAADHAVDRDVTGASGAGLVMLRQRWQELEGFAPEYFAYLEDAELSLRCWQRGWRVVYVAAAVVVHRYEVSRNPRKQHLLERNRHVLLLTALQARTLVLIALPLVALELALTGIAVIQGWGAQKARAWWWVLTHAGWIRRRRALLQRERTVPDRELAPLLVDRFEPGNLTLPAGAGLVNAALAWWWRLVRPLL
jgi:GT2 family glycosyltransferase